MAMEKTNSEPGLHIIVVGDDGTPAADAGLRFAQQVAADDARLVLARLFAHDPDDHSAADLAERAPAGGEARLLRGPFRRAHALRSGARDRRRPDRRRLGPASA